MFGWLFKNREQVRMVELRTVFTKELKRHIGKSVPCSVHEMEGAGLFAIANLGPVEPSVLIRLPALEQKMIAAMRQQTRDFNAVFWKFSQAGAKPSVAPQPVAPAAPAVVAPVATAAKTPAQAPVAVSPARAAAPAPAAIVTPPTPAPTDKKSGIAAMLASANPLSEDRRKKNRGGEDPEFGRDPLTVTIFSDEVDPDEFERAMAATQSMLEQAKKTQT